MPLDAQGNFTAGMPATPAVTGGGQNVLMTPIQDSQDAADAYMNGQGQPPVAGSPGAPQQLGIIGRNQKWTPIGGNPTNRNALLNSKTPVSHFAPEEVMPFTDYVKFGAARDKKDPSTMEDSDYLDYAKEYAEHILPLAHQSAGYKIDKPYVDGLVNKFQYSTFTNLPQIKQMVTGTAPPSATAATATSPSTLDSVSDSLSRGFTGFQNALAGMIPETQNAYLGAKGYLSGGKMSPEDLESIRQNENVMGLMNQDTAAAGTAGTVGSVLGNLAGFAVPLGGEAKLLEAGAAPTLAKVASAAAADALKGGLTKEAAEAAGKQAAALAARKLTAGGTAATLGTYGAGTAGADVAAKAASKGRTPTAGEELKAGVFGAGAGAVQAIPEARALQALRGVAPAGNALMRAAAMPAIMGGTGVASDVLHRAATGQDVATPEAIKSELEQAIPGAIAGIVPGAAEAFGQRNTLKATPEETKSGKTPPAGATTSTQPGETPPASVASDTVQANIKQALADVPLTKSDLKTPQATQAKYDEYKNSFAANMQQDGHTPEQIAALEPQVQQAFLQQHKLTSDVLAPESAEVTPGMSSLKIELKQPTTPAEVAPTQPTTAAETGPVTGTPEELNTAAQVPNIPREEPIVPSAVKEAAAPEREFSKLQIDTMSDLKDSLGREPTPQEVADTEHKTLHAIANQVGVNDLLYSSEEKLQAAKDAYEAKGEAPTANDVNEQLAKNKTEKNSYSEENVLTKKASAGEQVSEPAFNAAQDVSAVPTGRTVADVRQSLVDKLGEKAVAAMEKSGVLKIVQGLKDLPARVKASLGNGVAGGAYDAGTGHLVADHVMPGAEYRTLVHELGVHYGLRAGAIPKELYSLIEDHIQSKLKEDSPEGKEVQAAWQSAENAGTDPRIQTNETIAHMVQSELAKTPGSIWKRALDAIRTFAYDKIGKYLPASLARKLLNNQVIANLAKAATGRAAELRANDVAAQKMNEQLYGQAAFNKTHREKVAENTPERVMEAIRIKPKPLPEEVNPHTQTKWQAVQTTTFDKLAPLLHANQKLAAKGITVEPKADIYEASAAYRGSTQRESEIAEGRYTRPAMNWMYNKANQLGMSYKDFAGHLSARALAENSLERNEYHDLQTARLNKEGAIARQKVMDDWVAGKLSEPGAFTEALRDVVNNNRVGNKEPSAKSGISNQNAYALRAMSRKAGITDAIYKEFMDKHHDPMQGFSIAKGLESGKFSPQDEAMRSGIGWKNWFPAKDDPTKLSESGANFGAFAKEYKAAGGRADIDALENPIISLFKNVLQSSKSVAESEFTKANYNHAKLYGKDSGIKLETYNHDQEVRDAVAAGKPLNEVSRIPRDENTVIHNAGPYRFAIRYPEGSPMIKAINEMHATAPELNWFEKSSGFLTNMIARGATVFRPASFLMWNGPIRDGLYASQQIASDLGSKAMLRYWKSYTGSGGPLGAISTFYGAHGPRNALEREQFANSPQATKFAKSYLEMEQRGGGMSFEQGLNKLRNMEDINKEMERMDSKIAPYMDKLSAAMHVIDTMGSVDIMTGRVHAYNAYVETALDQLGRKATPAELEQIKKSGTVYSKQLLDYSQKSQTGMMLSKYIPFARVALTQTDRIIKTFTNADGSINKGKMLAYAGIGAAVSMMYYAMLRNTPGGKDQSNDTLSHNFVIPNGTNHPILIPMPYGITRLMLVPGMLMAKALWGDGTKSAAGSALRNTLMDTLTPFKPPEAAVGEGFSGQIYDMLEAFAPDYLKAPIDLGRNNGQFGQEIHKDDKYVTGSPSANGRASTPDFWKTAAKELKTMTGGAIDVFPESLEYMTSSLGTGPGTDFVRALHSGVSPASVLPKFTSTDADFAQRDKFNQLENDIKFSTDAYKKAEKLRDTQTMQQIKNNDPNIEKKVELGKEIEKASIDFGKARNQIESNKLMSSDVKQQKVQALSQQFAVQQAKILQEAQHYAK